MGQSVDHDGQIENNAVKHLIDSGFLHVSDVGVLHPRTRDRDDLKVLQCSETGVIFLQSSAHIDEAYYQDKTQEDPVAQATRSETVKDSDTSRRAAAHTGFIRGKRWLDVGCGECRLLKVMARGTEAAYGLEPTHWRVGEEDDAGFRVIRDTSDLGGEKVDVISLFHVLEHLTDPVATLQTLSSVLVPGGRFVIEVPHAREALLERYDCESYRNHTFWSEHLVLHTAESLAATIEAAGLRIDSIEGTQRYPLANHLYWLSHGKAGGQEVWRDLSTAELDEAYERTLIANGQTDTLTAIASLS